MQLSLPRSLYKGVIFPHQELGRSYYLLFHRQGLVGPFFVRDADLISPGLFYVGDIRHKSYDGPTVGNCFYTQVNHVSSGGIFCVAYSGVLGRAVDTTTVKGHDFGMELAIKSPHFLMWNKRGVATLVSTPAFSEDIRKNIEL